MDQLHVANRAAAEPRIRAAFKARVAGRAEGVGADEQAEARARDDLGQRGERRVALEDRLVGITDDAIPVVPGPDMVVAQRIDAARGRL
jgi:hypothetical protein